MNLAEELGKIIKGDVDNTEESRYKYSHDASLFEVTPEIIVFPKDESDIQNLVKFVNKNKSINPHLSLSPRSAGTCMSGGSLTESIVMDFTRYMNQIKEITSEHGVVQPGCYYRDFEARTLEQNRIMPAYTASREICAVGGMVANNSGGEKTIKWGKVENYIEKLKVIFSDGNVYEIKKMSLAELDQKCIQADFEGNLYSKLRKLIEDNYAQIMAAKPDVTKNSAGYLLWNVYDKDSQTFDLCRLIVGSQGTLGIITEITFKLVPVEKYSNLLAIFMPDIVKLGEIVSEITPYKPDSLESYDDYSMKLAVKFFFDFFKQLGFWGAIKLGLKFLPEAGMILTGGVPKLILLVEFTGESEQIVKKRLSEVQNKIAHFGFKTRIARSSSEAEKYWRIRRESFNMLRKHVQGKRTAPFIDDVIVKPEFLPEFLPQLEAILDQHKLVYTIAGHAGNGNFHIIPLMDLDSPFSGQEILDISQKVYDLVLSYKGSIDAEHNDGIIRTPYLEQMYGQKTYNLFVETKNIFDPSRIFNPGKKVEGSKEYLKEHIAKSHDHVKSL